MKTNDVLSDNPLNDDAEPRESDYNAWLAPKPYHPSRVTAGRPDVEHPGNRHNTRLAPDTAPPENGA